MSTTKYTFCQYVGWWHTFEYSHDNVVQEMEGRGFKLIGRSDAVDIQLKDQPIFAGALGPTYHVTDGVTVIHYEDADNWKNASNW